MSLVENIELHHADCLDVLKRMESRSVDLIYLDPPFFTKRVHRLSPRDRSQEFSFEDLWADQADYSQFLFERLIELRRVLSDEGSLFFHCDRHATHLIRTLLDRVFGDKNFRSEIIWHYRRWSNSKQGLLPSHQTIFYYSKTDHYTFNPLHTEYSPATNVDQLLQKRSRDVRNKSVYLRDHQGQPMIHGNKKGVPLGDVWDIPFLNPKARERVGYPTQKPLMLLDRIIHIASNSGDLVLDPFCGSGTTLVSARSLDRKAVGIDCSEDAIAITTRRLNDPRRSRSRLLELGREAYRNVDAAAVGLLFGLEFVPVHRNRGIDAILKQSQAGRPITIRVQRQSETAIEAAHQLRKASLSKGAALMFLVVTSRDCASDSEMGLPEGVIAVEAAAHQIRELLRKRSAAQET